MNKSITAIVFFALIASKMNGQPKTIRIGEQMPNIELSHVINYPKANVNISEFNGKLLILDFWATWCGPCVAMFPKNDSLQKMFDGRIQFLGITREDAKLAGNFLSRFSALRNITPVASVTGDTILNALFKHVGIPHYVWISESGKVLAITDQNEITRQNIQKYFDAGAIQLPIKKDPAINRLNMQKPAFVLANPVTKGDIVDLAQVELDNVLHHSVLTGYLSGISGYNSHDSTRATFINATIGDLYTYAVSHFNGGLMYMNRRRLETKDSLKYIYKGPGGLVYQQWLQNGNGFCYEITVSGSYEPDRKFDLMLDELNRYFSLSHKIIGVKEKRLTKCLALVRTTKEDKMRTKDRKSRPNVKRDKLSLSINNLPVSLLMSYLYLPFQLRLPPLDETGYSDNIDIKLECDLGNVNAVNRELEKYGLKFIEVEREIDMVVIKDIGSGLLPPVTPKAY